MKRFDSPNPDNNVNKNRPTIGDSLPNMGSHWTIGLTAKSPSKPSSQESRSGNYGSVKTVPCGVHGIGP